MNINYDAHTACKNCVFAIYKDKSQIGCQLNRIEKFKKNNAEILEAFDYDAEFFIINNRRCNALRTSEWLGDFDPIEEVHDEMRITCDLLVYIGKNTSYDDFKITIDSILNSIIKPKLVTFVNNQVKQDISQAETDEQDKKFVKWYKYLNNKLSDFCPFKLTHILEEDASMDRAIDITIKKFPNIDMYFLTMHAGYKLPSNLILSLDYALHYDMQEIVLATPDENNNFLFSQIPFYKKVYGNKINNFVKVATSHIEKFQCQHLITSITNLCPNYR